MKRLASFGSVESFWTVWTHLKRPSQLPPITDIYIFKLGIARSSARPFCCLIVRVWIDADSVGGNKQRNGKIPAMSTGASSSSGLKRGWPTASLKAWGIFSSSWSTTMPGLTLAFVFAPQLVLAMIGQQLEPGPAAASDSEGETSSSPARPSLPTATLEDAEEICGCVLSVRSNEDMISVRRFLCTRESKGVGTCKLTPFPHACYEQIWNRSRSSERREALRKTIQARIAELKLPINEKTGLTYKPHHDHLKNHNNNNHNSQNSPSSRNSHHHHNNSHRDHQHHNGHASKRMQRYDYPVRATDTVDEALEAELRDSQS